MKIGIMLLKCDICGKELKPGHYICFKKDKTNGLIPDIPKLCNENSIMICDNWECFLGLAKREKINKKITGDILKKLKKSLNRNKAEKLIGMGVRSGDVLRGVTAVEKYLLKKRISLVLVSEDAGQNTIKKMLSITKGTGTDVVVYNGNRPIEEIAGKPNCKVIGIKNSETAKLIRSELNVSKNTHSS